MDQICGGRPSLHRPVRDPEHQVRLLRQVPHRLVYEEQIECRDIVILAELDPEASRALAGVLYEGCSRARAYLGILYDEGLEEGLMGKIVVTV